MYEILKSIFKTVLPNSFLSKNEAFFRKLIAQRYAGNKYQCNICAFRLKEWVILERGDKLCPNCGSLPRTRRLSILLGEYDLRGKALLHFSPPKALRNTLSQISELEYITTDFESEFEADKQYDITNIDSEDERFDLTICYHVLEHIVEDAKAIRELYRITKSDGVVIVQTPFHSEPTFEDEKINTSELRMKHYGQKDHVRIYNAEDLKKRLELGGFSVVLKKFAGSNSVHGLKKEDTILIANRQS